MKYKVFLVLAFIALIPLFAEAQPASGIDETINQVFTPVSDFLGKIIFFEIPIAPGKKVPFVLIWLIAGALFFTFYFKFVNLTRETPKTHMLRLAP